MVAVTLGSGPQVFGETDQLAAAHSEVRRAAHALPSANVNRLSSGAGLDIPGVDPQSGPSGEEPRAGCGARADMGAAGFAGSAAQVARATRTGRLCGGADRASWHVGGDACQVFPAEAMDKIRRNKGLPVLASLVAATPILSPAAASQLPSPR